MFSRGLAATSSPLSRPGRADQREWRGRPRQQDHHGGLRTLRDRRKQGAGRRQHRHRLRSGSWHRRQRPAEEGRPRALQGQIGRPERLPLFRRHDGRDRERAPETGGRTSRSPRKRSIGAALSAHRRFQDSRTVRHGGAGSLAPPAKGLDFSRPIHTHRRGNRPDQQDRRVAPGTGMHRGGGVAEADQGGGQPVARAARQLQSARCRVVRAGRVRLAARAAGA